MPVTIATTPHPARKWAASKVSTAEDLFKESCSKEYGGSRGVNQTSFPRILFRMSHVSASNHGFVWSVVHAYSNHHNLTLRPEDVWFSILTQLSFFINAHAEELRSFFVAHEGQKELVVRAIGNIHTADLGALAVQMTRLIEENVVDKELRSWIMPDFSTTTRCACRVEFRLSLLLGQRKDWTRLEEKLGKLHQLGDEPARFAQLLRPVLNHFVQSFDNPESPEGRSFWSKCAERSGGSGPSMLSGWITAFCFWDEEGKLLNHRESIYTVSSPEFERHNTDFGLAHVLSREVETDAIPSGFASVPVTVDDNGTTYDTMMLAGLVGIQATSSGTGLDRLATKGSEVDSIKPLSGWWMYEKASAAGAEEGFWELYVTKHLFWWRRIRQAYNIRFWH